jgi:hypothetical protein
VKGRDHHIVVAPNGPASAAAVIADSDSEPCASSVSRFQGANKPPANVRSIRPV